MAEETNIQQSDKGSRKRRIGSKKGGNAKKKFKAFQGSKEKVKVDKRMKSLFRKRARDYNSDSDNEDDDGDGDDDDDDDDDNLESALVARDDNRLSQNKNKVVYGKTHVEESLDELNNDEENEFSEKEEEDDEIQSGITKFTEGCRAFKLAFKKILKKSVSEDSLGPVLSAHKKLVAEKLAEEESERKFKGEAKKEKQLVAEKGHVKPVNFLDSNEKFLIGVATKGVVKLFNAVNKAQNAQKGLNPSRFKDAKALRKRRKEAFFSELGKDSNSSKGRTSTAQADGEGPAWAPLRDNYMLTSAKLKDWDKMTDTTIASDDIGSMRDSSSDDE